MDGELLEQRGAELLVTVGPEEDEMGIEIRLEFRVGVILLTEQFAGSSATAVEIDEDQLVLGFGLGHRLLQGPLEPVLSGGGGGQDENRSEDERFFHPFLSLRSIPGGSVRRSL
jgi:hypothetical protein